MNRKDLLLQWLSKTTGSKDFTLAPASEDASFRSYYRVTNGNLSLIAMDAPPELEDCDGFVKVQKILYSQGVNVPQIHAFDPQLGFMLLTDFGTDSYLDRLNEETAISLYQAAIDELIKIQSIKQPESLPLYDSKLLQTELDLFTDWFIGQHLDYHLNDTQHELLQLVHERLIKNALEQPQVFVHRDYHSRNLMVTKNPPGVIDFQDAVIGPITYDLASLLKDCYVSWPQSTIDQLVKYYCTQSHILTRYDISHEKLTRWFDFMAVQRHLKAIGIFCRLNYRDGKKQYLNDIPRTINYVIKTAKKHEELIELGQLLQAVCPRLKT